MTIPDTGVRVHQALYGIFLFKHLLWVSQMSNSCCFYSQLELDLVPRVNGEAADVDQISVVELYKIVSKWSVIFSLHWYFHFFTNI